MVDFNFDDDDTTRDETNSANEHDQDDNGLDDLIDQIDTSDDEDLDGEVPESVGYGFFETGYDPARGNRQQYGYEHTDSSWWGLSEHFEADSTDWDEVYENIENLSSTPGLQDAMEEALRAAENIQERGFECSVCGLYHSHSTDKHDIRDFFGVTDEFADMLQWCAHCHCGVNELARLLKHYDHIDAQVFEHVDEPEFDFDQIYREVVNAAQAAPIPEQTQAEQEDVLGPIEMPSAQWQ